MPAEVKNEANVLASLTEILAFRPDPDHATLEQRREFDMRIADFFAGIPLPPPGKGLETLWFERAQQLEHACEGFQRSCRLANEQADGLIKLVDKFGPWLCAIQEGRTTIWQVLEALGRNRVALGLPEAPPPGG